MIFYDFGKKRVGWDVYPTIADEFFFLLSFFGWQQPLPSPFLSTGAGLSSHPLSLAHSLTLSHSSPDRPFISSVADSHRESRQVGGAGHEHTVEVGRLLWHISSFPLTFHLIALRPSHSIARENHTITGCQRQIPQKGHKYKINMIA